MTTLRDDILTIIQMYHMNDGWITRREIAVALDHHPSLLTSDDLITIGYLMKEHKIISRRIYDGFDRQWQYKIVEPTIVKPA